VSPWQEACQLLLSAADRLELPKGSAGPAGAALHPSVLARTIADQLLAAAQVSASAGPAPGPGVSTGAGRGVGVDDPRVALAAFVLGRMCRRGNADEAAAGRCRLTQ